MKLQKVKSEVQYKNVWLLLSIDSRNAQLNPLTFRKGYGYWSVVVTKLYYGLFMVPLQDRNREELDNEHTTIANMEHVYKDGSVKCEIFNIDDVEFIINDLCIN